MAYYLVTARLKDVDLSDLKQRLESFEIKHMRPFGTALDESLKGARVLPSGVITWEENDYCTPPLAMERAAVLDGYFEDIKVETVAKGEGWQRIEHLPSLWENA